MAEQRVHAHPRMSINALALYVSASPRQREQILRNQKYPSTFQVRWYDQASRAIVRYLTDPERDPDILTAAVERIRAQPVANENEQQKNDNNATAIVRFASIANNINFSPLEAVAGPLQGTLLLEHVTISLRPDVSLSGRYRNAAAVGGIKLYIKSGDALTEQGFACIGAVLHQFISDGAPSDATCAHRHCITVDVFGRALAPAPRAAVRTLENVRAACREIAHRWPAI